VTLRRSARDTTRDHRTTAMTARLRLVTRSGETRRCWVVLLPTASGTRLWFVDAWTGQERRSARVDRPDSSLAAR
jgi:hypothetical protein